MPDRRPGPWGLRPIPDVSGDPRRIKPNSRTKTLPGLITAVALAVGAAFVMRPAFTEDAPASSAFRDGHADREAWETWFRGLSGTIRVGAEFWASHRSDPRPPDCASTPDIAFRSACEEAKKRLALSDRRRHSDADYKAGWNSPLIVDSGADAPAVPPAPPLPKSLPAASPAAIGGPGGLGRALFARAEEVSATQTFICPNAPSTHPVFLTVDEQNQSLRLEFTSDTTNTRCLQIFIDGADAPVFRGASAGYCSGLFSDNETVHQRVRISGSTVDAFAHSRSGGDVGVILDRQTGIARFYAGKTLECHRARS